MLILICNICNFPLDGLMNLTSYKKKQACSAVPLPTEKITRDLKNNWSNKTNMTRAQGKVEGCNGGTTYLEVTNYNEDRIETRFKQKEKKGGEEKV